MKRYLGIELGSTRIKAVLIDENHMPVASGSHGWETRLEDGVWTYRLEDAWAGLRDCYAKLAEDFRQKYGQPLETVDAIGISAMMHGYLVFDKDDRQLVPFRTWRNTITEQAAGKLTALFGFNIPQRWSVAHLYQAILNNEPHVKDVVFMTTLAGYIHWKLTGQKVLGIGDASGMFPVDSSTNDYNKEMAEQFKTLTDIDLRALLPCVLTAGAEAGTLTAEGARLLDPTGTLVSGIPLCPPEADAGTGMVATNSVAPRTGNVSAGTSIFAMTVLEKNLSKIYPEVDIVATPAGLPVAMIHCNNCTTDIDAWAALFGEAFAAMGANQNKAALYDMLYEKALEAEADGGGLLSYNYYAGEHLTNCNTGRPLFVRLPDSKLTLANFMRTQLYAAMATLKIGMDILIEQENVELELLNGHGGLFKTPVVAQKLMASALNVPVAVMESAGEGGAWGIALLAEFAVEQSGQRLERFLDEVFAENTGARIEPNDKDREGFNAYMRQYAAGLAIERAAAEYFI